MVFVFVAHRSACDSLIAPANKSFVFDGSFLNLASPLKKVECFVLEESEAFLGLRQHRVPIEIALTDPLAGVFRMHVRLLSRHYKFDSGNGTGLCYPTLPDLEVQLDNCSGTTQLPLAVSYICQNIVSRYACGGVDKYCSKLLAVLVKGFSPPINATFAIAGTSSASLTMHFSGIFTMYATCYTGSCVLGLVNGLPSNSGAAGGAIV